MVLTSFLFLSLLFFLNIFHYYGFVVCPGLTPVFRYQVNFVQGYFLMSISFGCPHPHLHFVFPPTSFLSSSQPFFLPTYTLFFFLFNSTYYILNTESVEKPKIKISLPTESINVYIKESQGTDKLPNNEEVLQEGSMYSGVRENLEWRRGCLHVRWMVCSGP